MCFNFRPNSPSLPFHLVFFASLFVRMVLQGQLPVGLQKQAVFRYLSVVGIFPPRAFFSCDGSAPGSNSNTSQVATDQRNWPMKHSKKAHLPISRRWFWLLLALRPCWANQAIAVDEVFELLVTPVLFLQVKEHVKLAPKPAMAKQSLPVTSPFTFMVIRCAPTH